MAPRARSSDPWTSHAAAESVRSLNKKQSEVLKVFKTYGRMTDEDLLRLHKGLADFGQLEVQSDSGLRTRRRELADKGLVKAMGKTTNSRGRPTIVWGLPDDVRGQEELF